jgi:hypothetical protein
VEAKVFEVLSKGGDTGVRIYESSKKKKSSIFICRDELAWLVGALEEVAEADKFEIFWDHSRAGFPRILTQKRSNRHSHFLSIEEFNGRSRSGIILIPEGRFGQGWARLMVELDGAKSFLWKGRESRERKKGAMGPSNLLEQVHLLGKEETLKVKLANMINKAATSENGLCETAPTKTQGQVGRVMVFEKIGDEVYGGAGSTGKRVTPNAFGQPGSGLEPGASGEFLCGGVGAAGVQGDANPKGRWVQALLSPVPYSAEGACLSFPGKDFLREEAGSDERVFAFNAKVELYNCREWLRIIMGEVDAGLQKLDSLLRDVDFNGPGRMSKVGVPKPKRVLEPSGKKLFIPKAPCVGPGLGPIEGKAKDQSKSCEPAGVGSPKHFNGPLGGSCAKTNFSEFGLGSGHYGGDPSKVVGLAGVAVGRPGKCDPKSVGSAVRASSPRLGESGSGSKSEKAGSKGDEEVTESASKRGVTGSIQLSPVQEEKVQSTPVKEGKDFCTKTPASSRFEKRAAVTEPIKLQVYQRSRGRFSKPRQCVGVLCSIGQTVGQPTSMGVLGVVHSVSPVRLDFDGDDEVAGQPEDDTSPARTLGETHNSKVIVPESGIVADSAGLGMFGANPVEGEMLNLALKDGEIMGLTCEGKIGQLKEVLGSIIAENHGRGFGGERGSFVINES